MGISSGMSVPTADQTEAVNPSEEQQNEDISAIRQDEFLLKNGMDRSKMTQKELSVARSFMKAQEECPYT